MRPPLTSTNLNIGIYYQVTCRETCPRFVNTMEWNEMARVPNSTSTTKHQTNKPRPPVPKQFDDSSIMKISGQQLGNKLSKMITFSRLQPEEKTNPDTFMYIYFILYSIILVSRRWYYNYWRFPLMAMGFPLWHNWIVLLYYIHPCKGWSPGRQEWHWMKFRTHTQVDGFLGLHPAMFCNVHSS